MCPRRTSILIPSTSASSTPRPTWSCTTWTARRVRRHAALGGARGDGHPGHRGHRPQLVPREGGARHLGQARAGRGGRARCALLSREHLAASAHHRHLEHRAGHCSAARASTGVFDLKRRDRDWIADVLYGEFGVNAEYLIDHAWGVEPCTIAEIKRLRARRASSTMNGQILPCGYTLRRHPRWCCARWWTSSVLDLVEKHLVTESYLAARELREGRGWGRGGAQVPADAGEGPREGGRARSTAAMVPGAVGGSASRTGAAPARFPSARTPSRSSTDTWRRSVRETVRSRPAPCARSASVLATWWTPIWPRLDLFTDVAAADRERRRAEAVLAVKGKFGKNALIKGTSLKEHALGRERNTMVGGHHG